MDYPTGGLDGRRIARCAAVWMAFCRLRWDRCVMDAFGELRLLVRDTPKRSVGFGGAADAARFIHQAIQRRSQICELRNKPSMRR